MTCDNASNNDTLIKELAELVDDFPGAAAQTRCFAHVTNLSAKSFLHSFDSPTSSEGEPVASTVADDEVIIDDDGIAVSTEGWVDEVAEMTVEEREKLNAEVEPVRKVLKKVSPRTLSV
jgi:hypothetical protein